MRIVPARVHHAGRFGGEIEPGVLEQRQRIHIAAQQHGARVRPVPSHPPAQDRDQPGRRRPLAKFERQPSERVLDLGERLRVMKTELGRSEENTSELQSLMRNSYAVLCCTKQQKPKPIVPTIYYTSHI